MSRTRPSPRRLTIWLAMKPATRPKRIQTNSDIFTTPVEMVCKGVASLGAGRDLCHECVKRPSTIHWLVRLYHGKIHRRRTSADPYVSGRIHIDGVSIVVARAAQEGRIKKSGSSGTYQ